MSFHRGQHVRSPSFEGVALWFIRRDGDRAIVRMVGDDQDHEVDYDELAHLDEDAFCSGCGQIGCTAYASS